MKKFLALMLVLTLSLSLVACGPQTTEPTTSAADPTTPAGQTAPATSSDAMSETATTAPAFDWKQYAGTTLKVSLAYGGAEKSFDAFTEKTGIKVEYVSMSTGKELAKLQAEEGKTANDIWFGGGVDSYIAASKLGYLEAYVSPEAEAIPTHFKDKEGFWTALSLVPAGFLVNNDVLKEKGIEAPKTWKDLGDPKYKGEIIIASPAISGTQYAITNRLLQAWGEEEGWKNLAAINENVEFYAKSGGEPGPKTAAGEYAVAVLALAGGTFALEKEHNVTAIYPEDMIPWTPAPIGIFANSQNKEAAKLFVDYYLSKEGQEKLRDADPRIMARTDVAAPTEIGTVDFSKLIEQDVLLFGEQREAILKRWAELAGDKDAK
ncbi:MAG: ABC transporter substrate-binding protein [Bacillota bacterium]|nr:ABC transporter substrate-binding protein [Bacillota bacterium]